MSFNSRHEAIQIIDLWKAFHRQRIPESSFLWKEIVDIGILVTPRNIDRKMKNNRIDLPRE